MFNLGLFKIYGHSHLSAFSHHIVNNVLRIVFISSMCTYVLHKSKIVYDVPFDILLQLFSKFMCSLYRLVSGSRDATLRIWDIDSGHCLRVLIGHVAAVRCVQFDGRRVVSGAYDYMVKIWDPDTETCLQTLAGHTNRVYSLQVNRLFLLTIKYRHVIICCCTFSFTITYFQTSVFEVNF